MGPRLRVDVSLPSAVAVVELLPRLLQLCRVGPVGATVGGVEPVSWGLSRLGGGVLDPDRTLASLGVADGELLLLATLHQAAVATVHDDPAEALAAASRASAAPWTAEWGGRLAVGVAAAALVMFAGTLWDRASSPDVVWMAGGGAALFICLATVIARTGGPSGVAVLFGMAALPLVALAAARSTSGPPMTGWLFASGSVLLVAPAVRVLVDAGRSLFTATASLGALGTVTFAVSVGVRADDVATAAGAVVVGIAAMVTAPRLAARLAGLTSQRIGRGAAGVDVADLAARSRVAGDALTGLFGAASAVVAAAAVVLTATDDRAAVGLGCLALVLVGLRARGLQAAAPVLALLGPVTVAAMIGMARVVDAGRSDAYVVGLWPAAAAAALLLGLRGGRQSAPTVARVLRAADAGMLAAVIPLAFAAMGLYRVARQF